MPAAREDGLPLGLSLIGGPFSGARLLAVAAGVEQGLAARVPPTLPPARVALTG